MNPQKQAKAFQSQRVCNPLNGDVTIPGDKSISHRAFILGGLATGVTEVTGLLEGEDVLATGKAMQAMGAGVERLGDGHWKITGCGTSGLKAPATRLDFGNAGTGARLLMGAISGSAITADMTGDASLCKRPMGRVMQPLTQMGARFDAAPGDRLPATITAPQRPLPLVYQTPVPSAQVKSAILLAGLGAPGNTTIFESEPTRDHTERMLRLFGANVTAMDTDKGLAITLTGEAELRGTRISVPGDPSSAAFPLVAALLVAGSEVRLNNVMVNPHRDGLWVCLRDMGADIDTVNLRDAAGEQVADFIVRASTLSPIEVPAERAPSMIDEYPILAIAAACAKGTSVFNGLAELRVKESDRLAAIADGLAACGVDVEAGDDSLTIHGKGQVPGGGEVKTCLDHRIAMSFLILGLVAEQPVMIDDAEMIATSFPDFFELMQKLGTRNSFAAVDAA